MTRLFTALVLLALSAANLASWASPRGARHGRRATFYRRSGRPRGPTARGRVPSMRTASTVPATGWARR